MCVYKQSGEEQNESKQTSKPTIKIELKIIKYFKQVVTVTGAASDIITKKHKHTYVRLVSLTHRVDTLDYIIMAKGDSSNNKKKFSPFVLLRFPDKPSHR